MNITDSTMRKHFARKQKEEQRTSPKDQMALVLTSLAFIARSSTNRRNKRDYLGVAINAAAARKPLSKAAERSSHKVCPYTST